MHRHAGRFTVFLAHTLLATLCVTLSGCAHQDQNMRPSSEALKTEIESFVSAWPQAEIAVALIDPETGTHLSIKGDRVFHAASTMKAPVLIEVYRQAAAGRFSLDDSLLVENDFTSIVDGSPFRIGDDSDDALYEHTGHSLPIRDLAERMITMSSNLATNLIIELVKADSVQRTMEGMGARTMRVLRGVEDIKAFERGLNNTATASDLAALLDAIRRNEAVSRPASEAMRDILLGQEFNEMIPAGLPGTAQVAHKTGWITGITHDAAIVYPENAPPYVLVILTEGFDDHATASQAGAGIARMVHDAVR